MVIGPEVESRVQGRGLRGSLRFDNNAFEMMRGGELKPSLNDLVLGPEGHGGGGQGRP